MRDMAGRAGPAAGDTGALHGGRAPAFVFAKHILVEMGPSGLPILTFRVAPATAARRYLCPQLRCHVLREAALPDGELLSQSLRVAMDDDDTASFPGYYLLRHTVSKRECVWLFGWHMTRLTDHPFRIPPRSTASPPSSPILSTGSAEAPAPSASPTRPASS